MSNLRQVTNGRVGVRGEKATERHMAVLGPLTAVVALTDFETWYAGAAPGHVCIYAIGIGLPADNATCRRVRELIVADAVSPTQRRTEDGRRIEYRVERNGVVEPTPESDRARSIEAIERDIEGQPEGRVLKAIKRAANFDHVCPSHAEMAQKCDLPNRDAARYRMDKLVQMGLISIHHRQNERRIVTVVSSGKSTRGGV